MIQEGVVSLQMRLGQDLNSEQEFFVLPTYSYFGDYQILFDLKSQIIYKAKENKLLITLCLDKSKLLELMDDFPEARKFYMERAWLRRIEFRRRQKKFIKELIAIDLNQYNKPDKTLVAENEAEASEESSGISDEDSVQSDSEVQKALVKKNTMINDAISKNISRFFFNLDIEKELDEDFGDDELEDFSDDEIEPDAEDMLKEDNKKISYSHAKQINEQMIKMSEAFTLMTKSTEKNLNSVQDFIKKLQQSSKNQGSSSDVAIPKLEQLSKVVESVNDQIQEKVLEIEQEHQINSKQRMVMVGEMKQTFTKGQQSAADNKNE